MNNSFSAKTIHIVGQKNSGKTTLMQWLISELTAAGLKVGAFKHSSHSHPLDKEGSDSQKFSAAGASPSVFNTTEGYSITLGKDDFASEELMSFLYRDCDVVLIESFRGAPHPKIVIANNASELENISNVIGVVSRRQAELHENMFGWQDQSIIAFIRERLAAGKLAD